jgi:hypothetical protein
METSAVFFGVSGAAEAVPARTIAPNAKAIAFIS